MTIAVGIDPGVNTGMACWCIDTQCFTTIATTTYTSATSIVLRLRSEGHEVHLVVEDCRNMWVSRDRYNSARMRGVGSVQRDVSLWIEFAEHHGFDIRLPKPGKYRKVTGIDFKTWTGWKGLTSEHARAAAMQVWQMKRKDMTDPLLVRR